MTNRLLEIQSSVRVDGSMSHRLSQQFIDAWMTRNAVSDHVLRDIGSVPPPFPTAAFMRATYTPPAERTAEMAEVLRPSEELIAELVAADRIVVGLPMYNWTVPSTFKAWVDNVVRVGRTFTYDPTHGTFAPLLKGKKALVVSTSAADMTPGAAHAALDYLGPYVRAIFAFMGVTDLTLVRAGNQFAPQEVRQQSLDAASDELLALAENW